MKFISFFAAIVLLQLLYLIGCNTGPQPLGQGEAVSAAQKTDHPQTTNTDGIQFLSSYTKAFEQARSESKPLMVFFSLSDCANSKRMKETTFQDPEIQRLSRQFVCVSVDASLETELCESLQIKGFPTILIMNGRGMEIHRLSGGRQTTEQLTLQMHVAIQTTAANAGSAVRK